MPGVLDAKLQVHPTAICESAEVGEGTRLWAYAHLMAGAVIGRDCNIGDHAFVESGARLGDRVTVKNNVLVWEGVTVEDEVFLGPGMIFTNDLHPRSPRMAEVRERYGDRANWLRPTTVRRGAAIGAGAVILCDLTIGRYACVGAGAVVTRDVADHRIVVGNPARVFGWACVCGAVLDGELCCGECRRSYCVVEDRLEAVE
ncbi:MAG: N-acetyltransferase [bacterium]|nr:N-acetyltransferase [bacterium]